jgi:aspartate 1-decarboxylase
VKTWVAAKIHGIRVTDASIKYHGSVTIGADLMEAAGIEPYEQVQVVDLATGHRWETYALPGAPGVFTLNGGARLGAKEDECVVITYKVSSEYEPAKVVFCDADNNIVDTAHYR